VIFAIYLVFRAMLFAFVVLAVLSIFALWAFCWVLIFVISFIYVGFDEGRAKRLRRPRITQRTPQARWSDRQ
jgi:hypothetical protein